MCNALKSKQKCNLENYTEKFVRSKKCTINFDATPVKVLQVKEVSVDIDEIDDESNHAAEK